MGLVQVFGSVSLKMLGQTLTLLNLIVLSLSTVTTASQSQCGGLITYNQYTTLLNQTQPNIQCFREGCSAPLPASTMSSQCPQSSSCSALWDILQDQWQRDWCATCPDDIACRIPGWPILNATAACAVIPHNWVFSTSGQCCVSDDEPFQLAAWIGSFCNGSQWRAPFDYYGGMAKEDWEEWIEPWNWTVCYTLAAIPS